MSPECGKNARRLYDDVQAIFDYLAKRTDPEQSAKLSSFEKYVLEALDDFSRGEELRAFTFDISQGSTAVQFEADGLLSVYKYGYSRSQYGGDSYEAWRWELACDEEQQFHESGEYCFDANWVVGGAADGMELCVYSPDEYGTTVSLDEVQARP